MDAALREAEAQNKASGDGSRAISGSGQLMRITEMLSSVPGAGELAQQAQDLQAKSDAQERDTESQAEHPSQNIPGTNIDPLKTAKQIYPILEFRDRVVKIVNSTIEKIPGLEALVERITDTLTLFVLSLLAPFIRPIINAVSKQLKAGSGGVIDASKKGQYQPWTDPHCSDPTHSLLSKDHFSNILNEPAGQVASTILQYVAPRVIYAWQHPNVPVEQVLNDVTQVFHHPALRNQHCQLHRDMFSTVERWAHSRPDGGSNLNVLLSSESVRHGRNLTVDADRESQTHSHGGLPSDIGNFFGSGSQSKTRDGPWEQIGKMREMSDAGLSGSSTVVTEGNPTILTGEQTKQDNLQPTMAPRPPVSTSFGYLAQPNQQQFSYGQPSYAPNPEQGQPFYDQPPPFQYGAQPPPNEQGPNYGGYGLQPPNWPGTAPPSNYDPNAPPPPQQYGYSGPPQPPGPFYGGGPY